MVQRSDYKNLKGEEYSCDYYSPKSIEKLKDIIYETEAIYMRDFIPFLGRRRTMLYALSDGRIVETFGRVGNIYDNFRHYCFWLIDSGRLGNIYTFKDKHKRKLENRFKKEIACYAIPPQLGSILKASGKLIYHDLPKRRYSIYEALTSDVIFYDFLSDVFIVFPSIEEWNKVSVDEDYSKLISPW